MDEYNIMYDWIENGGDYPSDNLDEEEVEYILNHMEPSTSNVLFLQLI